MINHAYLESRILSADPVELIRLLYQGAVSAVRTAREHLAQGDVPGRCAAVSKAMAILTELASSLDHTQGGEISRNLDRLYEYMQQRLLDANMKKSDEPLAEVLGLLTTLSEAWQGVKTEVEHVDAPAPVWTGRFDVGAGDSQARAWDA